MHYSAKATALVGIILAWGAEAGAQGLPFKHKIELYRDKEGETTVFSLVLEQPFFAEEFEKSNYLRLQPLDRNAHLIYPKETKFQQKHAAFYGRLRGAGTAKLRLAYETVSENIDGTRRVETREGEVEISIPTEAAGPKNIYLEWARQQNAYFLELLNYYPRETFLQYALLQSKDRYGVAAPKLPAPPPAAAELETNLYAVATGALALQESLQMKTLSAADKAEDLDVHISALAPPALRSPAYEELLKKKREKDGAAPKVHEIAKLIPEDQYLFQFNSMSAAGDLFDLTRDWGGGVTRLMSVQARHNRLQEKFEDQLLLRRDFITKLFADAVIAEMALTGSDLFFIEGTDVTFIFRLAKPEIFNAAAERWLKDGRAKFPQLVEREFNYRGHKIAGRYTEDRLVSSFVARHDAYVIYSNSHAAIRRIIDALVGATPRLHDALDYRYLSALLPPADGPQDGYFYASEAFLRRQVGPALKISEKRRVQCFNNLVMLNNASLLYRLENGKSPASLSDLVAGQFIDPAKLICPHGGAYAFDAQHDTGTCSLHNRLKYMTPNAEISVLKVSRREQKEYDRYKERYEAFWQGLFDPIAVRVQAGQTVKLETCVLPLANGGFYTDLRNWLHNEPRVIDTTNCARSTVASFGMVLGRKRIADDLRELPGIPEVLAADPTLTDLSWLGDRVSVHLCDEDAIVEIDPTRLRTLNLFGEVSVGRQSLLALAMTAASLPAYVSIDVEDRDKAQRFLDLLSSKILLKGDMLAGLPTVFDAYRLPDYKGHANYVLSYQFYALKVRLHVTLIGDRLVAATKAQTLREVIDAADIKAGPTAPPCHLLLRLNLKAQKKFKDDLRLYWAEKSRLACHNNIMSIYNLLKLYETPIAELNRLSEAKYGVDYFCPDGGAYQYDAARDQVLCGVHGNRQNSRQTPALDQGSSFSRFIESLDEITARLRFQEDGLIATLEIVRRGGAQVSAGP